MKLPLAFSSSSSSSISFHKDFPDSITRTRTIAHSLFVAINILAAGSILQAAEKYSLPPETATFKSGPGAELALGQCLLCHSADYVSTQPRLTRAAWKTSVLKMRDKYGAPIPEDNIAPLVDYLVKTYGLEANK